MDSESRNNNLERLTNMGYDLVTAQKYLTLWILIRMMYLKQLPQSGIF